MIRTNQPLRGTISFGHERVPFWKTLEVSCRLTRRPSISRPTTPTSKVSPTRSSPSCARHNPVAWTEEADGGRGFWSLTKYDDVLYASRHTELFSSRFGIRMEDMDDEETEARRTMMEMDSPEHTRLRRIVARPFTPRAVADYEDAVRELAREVLTNLEGATRIRLRQGRRARTADEDARSTAGSARRGPRLVGESRRRPHRQHRPRLHGLRRRPDRHQRLSAAALSQPGRDRAVRVRPTGAGRNDASRRPTTS